MSNEIVFLSVNRIRILAINILTYYGTRNLSVDIHPLYGLIARVK